MTKHIICLLAVLSGSSVASADVFECVEGICSRISGRDFNVAKPVAEPFDLTSEYDAVFVGAGRAHKIDVRLLKAVAKIESNFDPNAVSEKGAMGVMQLLPRTAEEMGVINIFDARENIFGGAKYLSERVRIFNGDIRFGLAAYHGGTQKLKERGFISGEKTIDYVNKVMAVYDGGRKTSPDHLGAVGARVVHAISAPSIAPHKDVGEIILASVLDKRSIRPNRKPALRD